MLSKIRGAAALLLCLSTGLGGCGDTAETAQTPTFSALAELDRSAVRTVLRHYRQSSPDGMDVRTMMSMIAGEGMRHFPQANYTNDFVISGYDFALVDALPATDYWGDPDPTGGYVPFSEVVHDSDGDEVSDGTNRKRTAYFTTGDVQGFAYDNTRQSEGAMGERLRSHLAYSLQSDAQFNLDVWHQQRASTRSSDTFADYGEVYSYTSHPGTMMTVQKGGRYEMTEVTTDTISSTKGWHTHTNLDITHVLAGTITRYQPRRSNAPANTDAESDINVDEDTSGDVLTRTTNETTVFENEVNVGVMGELIQTARTTNTSHSVTKTNTTTGELVSSSSEVHETTAYTYTLRAGFGALALQGRGFELYTNHVETIRTLVDVTVQGVERVTDTTIYRHTDNRATRNDIYGWRSTRQSTKQTSTDEGWTLEDSGVEWLVSEIEVDPDFNAVAYDYHATTGLEDDAVMSFFGDDDSAYEETNLTTVTRDEDASWADSRAKVSGSHTLQSSTISNGNGQSHSVGSNADGVYTITVGDIQETVGAEEWLDSIAP